MGHTTVHDNKNKNMYDQMTKIDLRKSHQVSNNFFEQFR